MLRKYCQQWGFSAASKRKKELVALAYSKEEESEERQQYNELLPLDHGSIIPNPFGFYVDRLMS